MERLEMVEQLMNKANVTKEVAEEALENSNWDILDAIVYLERKENSKEKKENKNKDESGGVCELIGRIARGAGRILRKSCHNYFEIKKDGEKPIKINLLLSLVLLIFGFWIVGILLVVGLFSGYKYSIVGKNMNCDEVNDVLNKVSESAETIKNDFKEGYNS